MPEFLFFPSEEFHDDVYIIEAEDEQHAIMIYAQQIGVHDASFLEWAYSFIINAGFGDSFWFAGSEQVSEQEFSRRVIEFFGEEDGNIYRDYFLQIGKECSRLASESSDVYTPLLRQAIAAKRLTDSILLKIWLCRRWINPTLVKLQDIPRLSTSKKK